jgi:hypothetical protein
VYKITIMEEYAKINNLSSIITFDSGIAAKIGDLGLMEPWKVPMCRCTWRRPAPRLCAQLYKGLIWIFSNRTASLEGGLALKVKEQVDRLELQHMFGLFGNSVLHTHIPNITIFAHQNLRMETANGKHLEGAANTTRLESTMIFCRLGHQ